MDFMDKTIKEAMELCGTDSLDDCLKRLREMENKQMDEKIETQN